ncbi:patatin-like phospholipase family protein [Fibrella aquatica]|uniref:patatin-like phospholipase family protein n=1 Tax=Fibrella aquatica TaxID=3242487 RepID=UPI00352033AD
MKIGLVLSGGGARGIAHLGVIKAILEQGIQISRLSGTSAGAIAGALTATGYLPDEALKIIESSSLVRHLRPAWTHMGLLRIDTAIDLYRKYIPKDSFEALNIPLHVAAVDMNAGEVVIFEEGELIRPILASCCLPGIFEPLLINKKQYIDGGVLNNLPVESLLGKVDYIIGSHCNPFPANKPIRTARGVIERSLVLSVRSRTKERMALCNFVIEPPSLVNYSVSDIKYAREIFQAGYLHARTLRIADAITSIV